jgi:hypothetical protein
MPLCAPPPREPTVLYSAVERAAARAAERASALGQALALGPQAARATTAPAAMHARTGAGSVDGSARTVSNAWALLFRFCFVESRCVRCIVAGRPMFCYDL